MIMILLKLYLNNEYLNSMLMFRETILDALKKEKLYR